MVSNDNFSMDGGTENESTEKSPENHTDNDIEFDRTYQIQDIEFGQENELSKETSNINLQDSDKSLKKYPHGEWKLQNIAFDDSSKVKYSTDKEPIKKPSIPQLVSSEKSPEKKPDIFDVVGTDGLWQRCMFTWKFCFAVPTAFHYLIMTFLAPDVDYWCAKPAELNWTTNEWKAHGLPEDKHCSRYENTTTLYPTENFTWSASDTVSCEAWEYDTSFYTSTVVGEWNLVCEREWLASFSLAVFNVGTLLSSLVIGHLGDILGRKRIIVTCLTLAVFSAIACAFSLSYTMFLVTRFLAAFGLSGVYNVSYVLLLEITGPKERSFYGTAMNFGWCIGFIILPGITWLLRDWFWIEIAITIPYIVLLLTCWILPESPRWLLVKGRVEEAEKILIKSARMNGRKISDQDVKLRTVINNAQKAHNAHEASGGILDLVCTPGLRVNTLNIWFLWFANSFIYYGLSYSTNALPGNPYINFVMSGLVEIPACIIAILACHYIGRTKPLAYTTIIGAIACLCTCILPNDPWWLNTAVSMSGKCSITIALHISFVSTAEIFPTVVRNAGVGSASFFSRLASILSPFVKELGNATHPVVPQIAFGILGCVSGFLVFLLPETKGMSVPETIEEALNRKSATKNKDIENAKPVI